jgi:hypothetical protein
MSNDDNFRLFLHLFNGSLSVTYKQIIYHETEWVIEKYIEGSGVVLVLFSV